MEAETRQLLYGILEMLKQQAVYLYRIHGWVIAVSETVENEPALRDKLRSHPSFDQGPLPWLQTTDEMIRRIDMLIRKLRADSQSRVEAQQPPVITKETQDIIRALAEETYRRHLLVKSLIERGLLRTGELDVRWDGDQWKKFLADFWGSQFPGLVPPPRE